MQHEYLQELKNKGKTAAEYFNALDSTVTEKTTTPSGSYIEKTYNARNQTYSIIFRQQKYSKPLLLTDQITQERDADQILLAAEQEGISELLTPNTDTERENQ